jgi:hypothetical protein
MILKYVKIKTLPIWYGFPNSKTENVLIDPHKTSDLEDKENPNIKSVKLDYIMGIYFFLGPTKVVHSNIKFTILDLLSKFGGLYGSLFQFLGLIGGFYNSRMLLGHLISKLYFIQYRDTHKGHNHKASEACHLKTINFARHDVFYFVKLPFCKLKSIICHSCCGKKK